VPLDIHDVNEDHNTWPPTAIIAPQLWTKLPGRSHIPSDTSFHRHIATWLLHGGGKQSSHPNIRNPSNSLRPYLLHLYIPTFHSLNAI